VVIGDCLRRQRQASQLSTQRQGVSPMPMARMVAIWVAVHHRAASSREHRPTTLVQLELIRTAATRAANAVGLGEPILLTDLLTAALDNPGWGWTRPPLSSAGSLPV
jgi:hypothetical protein